MTVVLNFKKKLQPKTWRQIELQILITPDKSFNHDDICF